MFRSSTLCLSILLSPLRNRLFSLYIYKKILHKYTRMYMKRRFMSEDDMNLRVMYPGVHM